MKKRSKLGQIIIRSIRLAALAGAMAMYSATSFAAVANDALPTKGQFMGGSTGSILSANGVMTVNQTTQNASIKWETFNVGANATVNFNYNNKQDGYYNILNFSKNGGLPSEIYGRLKAGANANVWLVNPHGVIIGKGAQIDVGHMHLAARDLEGKDFSNKDTKAKLQALVDSGSLGNGELMNMGNAYVNEITFDGNRVVIDADKLYTYAGDKVELGAQLNSSGEIVERELEVGTSNFVKYIGWTMDEIIANKDSSSAPANFRAQLGNNEQNNTGVFAAASAKYAKNGNTYDASQKYLTIGDSAKEIVVGYSLYNSHHEFADGRVGSYANAINGRNFYVGDNRVGFGWVEDSTQLERIGESEKVLSLSFALKDGIAAINTKEMNDGKGFNPIGDDLNNPDPFDPHHNGVAFTGKFDGLNYDIYGLTINRPDSNDIGLFGHVGDGAVIRNVNLVSGSIVGNNNVGGVIGHLEPTAHNITIENVKNSARVLGVSNVGGIIGKAEGSASAKVTITNAENVGLVRGNSNVGGIVGNMTYTDITGETYNTGAVRGIVNYKTVTYGYKTKTAEELVSANYDISKEETVVYHSDANMEVVIDSTHTMYFEVLSYDDNKITCKYKGISSPHATWESLGNETAYVTFSNTNGGIGNLQGYRDNGTTTGFIFSNKNWTNRAAVNPTKETLAADVSSNVGGIAGSMSSFSSIGNTKIVNSEVVSNGFQIYNDVEVVGGYNVGGIVGSMNGGRIQNVMNNSDVRAEGYNGEYYYYQTNHNEESADDGHKASTNEGVTSIARQTLNTANAGGIAGNVVGRNSADSAAGGVNIANLKDVINKGDVASQKLNATESGHNYTYYEAGNVGGIVGKADGATITENSSNAGVIDLKALGSGIVIDNAVNVENTVRGAHNVGGIVGDMLNTTVKNSTNEGGDVSATGALKVNAFAKESVRQNASNNHYFIGNIGGIAGYMEGSQSYIEDSRNRGNIHTADVQGAVLNYNKAANIGGIAGKVGARYQYLNGTAQTDANSVLFGGIGLVTRLVDADGNPLQFDQGDGRWEKADGTAATIAGFDTTKKIAIKDTANTGVVSGYTGIGGIVGQMYNGEITTSYNMGNVKTAFFDNASNEQANLGGILGDTPARSQSFVRVYDVYNTGMIGDSTYTSYGRHLGGIVGRLRGELDKAYNAGDVYNGADNTGGIAGYVQTITGGFYASISNVFNAGNVTIINKFRNSTTNSGGIIGVGGGSNITLTNAYNLGVVRSFNLEGSGGGNAMGALVGGVANGNTNIRNSYSTGEIFAGKINSMTDTNAVKDTNDNVKFTHGNVVGGVYYIKPEDTSSTSPFNVFTNSYSKAIDYANRYDIAQWAVGGNNLVGNHYTSTSPVAENLGSGSWRMYLYDEDSGETVTHVTTPVTIGGNNYNYYYEKLVGGTVTRFGVLDANVKATMPILNAFIPNISKYFSGANGAVPATLKYVQYGNELNPLMSFVNVNSDGDVLTIDHQRSNLTGRGGVTVNNGGLTINNLISNRYISGTFMAQNGDLVINAGNDTLNLASDSKFYGKNVTINNGDHDVNSNGNIYSYSGNVVIKGDNIDIYGGITSSSIYDDTLLFDKNGNGVYDSADGDIKALNQRDGKYYLTIEGVGKTSDNAPAYATNYVNVKNAFVEVQPKSTKYDKEVEVAVTPGQILITADHDYNITDIGTSKIPVIDDGGAVGLYLGQTKSGKITTDGRLTIIGKSIYSDIDMKVGVGAQSIVTMKADNIIFDVTNIGITAPIAAASDEEKRRITLNQMFDDFKTSNPNGNAFRFESLASATVAADAKVIIDFFGDNNELNVHRYDMGSLTLGQKADLLDVKNGGVAPKENLVYSWISNAKQLENIQKAYEAASTSVKADIMATNFALKNDIDASEITSFKAIGTGDANGYVGIFDGMGHNLNAITSNTNGLFETLGRVTHSGVEYVGTVKNLNINSSRLTGSGTRVGLVAATNKGQILNVKSFGNTVKEGTNHDVPTFIGGLVGLNDTTGVVAGGSKTEDIVYSETENYQTDVGGVVGLNAGIVHNVTGKSDVSVAEGGATSLGGVVGVNAGLIKDAFSLGVTSGLYEKQGAHLGEVIGADNVGGIAGENRTMYRALVSGVATNIPTNGITYRIEKNADGTYTYNGGAGESFTGGTVADVYNDSKVKGWSNTGGVIGQNFGVGNETKYGGLSMPAAAKAYYIANAADVIAGSNAGGLVGTNDAQIGDTVTSFNVESQQVNASGTKINPDVVIDGTTLTFADQQNAFEKQYLISSEGEISQIIYGRNSGKITGRYGMVQGTEKSMGINVGGLVGISGTKANVENLVNGKAASVYGAVNVGGLIGENQGILQKSTNMMQNNEIAGAWQVGGIVGKNTGVIVGIENTNKYNINTNMDYVSETDGKLNAKGKAAVVAAGETSPVYASYFGGVAGSNAVNTKTSYKGVIGDVINFANVTIDRPAHYVGGIMGRNDATIASEGMSVANPAGGAALSIKPQGYLRNNGQVGVMTGVGHIVEGGQYIGGIIGQNNSAISGTDITNNIGGGVTGDMYVGGIIGENTAAVTGGRDTKNNYYKYDVYSNGKVTGNKYVGGLIGSNAASGSITMAYNTGVVSGMDIGTTTNAYIGGIVGYNAGKVDQVFNSTGAYDNKGVEIANKGVSGNNYVGGLVGMNDTGAALQDSYNAGDVHGTGTSPHNIGNVVGQNKGSVSHVYATNATGKFIGDVSTGTMTQNISVSSGDSAVSGKLNVLSGNDRFNAAKYVGFSDAKWTFQDGVSTPLLKNFLTKAYFVGDATEVYNGKKQIVFVDRPVEYKYNNSGVIETYYRSNVYVQDEGNAATRKYVGFVYAADEKGDHTIEDFYRTYGLTGNSQQNLIIGNDNTALTGDGKTHAGTYTLLSSSQINTNYVERDAYGHAVIDSNGLANVNPNMLGYEFLKSSYAVTRDPATGIVTIPTYPNPVDPQHPHGPVVSTLPPVIPDTVGHEGNDPYNTLTDPTPVAPKLTITKRQLTVNLDDILMVYGSQEAGSTVTNYNKNGIDYTYGGKKIAEKGVNNLYKVTYDGLVENDSAIDIIGYDLNADKTKFINNGFITPTQTENVVYDSFDKPTVAAALELTVDTAHINATHDDYDIQYGTNAVNAGMTGTTLTSNVTIVPRALDFDGNTVYRTYGDAAHMYSKDSAGNVIVDANGVPVPATHGHTADKIIGWAAGEEGKAIYSGTWFNTTPVTESDGALDAGKTRDVGVYEWIDGILTIDGSAAYDTAQLNNYRVYDHDKEANSENPFVLATGIGGISIVEPAKLTIKVDNANQTYGDQYGSATEGFTFNVKDSQGHDVLTSNNSVNKANVQDTNKLLYGDKLSEVIDVSKLLYDNQAFEGNDVNDYTKDVGNYDLNLSVTKNTGTGNKAGNYIITVEKGNVTVDQREVYADSFTVENIYGSQLDLSTIDKDVLINITHILDKDKNYVGINRDNLQVSITTNDGDTGNTSYKEALDDKIAHPGTADPTGIKTPNVGTYNKSLDVSGVTLGAGVYGDKSGNYKFVTKPSGSVKVTPADIVIQIKDGAPVVYGSVGNLNTSDQYGNDVQVLQDTLNGDKLSTIVQYNIRNGAYSDAVEREVSGKHGTNDVGEYKMQAADVASVGTVHDDGSTSGTYKADLTSANYNTITIINGKVNVTPRNIVVIPEGKPIPTNDPHNPFKPGDDPVEKYNPDVIYVKANDVSRTYGDVTKDHDYDVQFGGFVVPWDTGKVKWDPIADNGLMDGHLTATDTNNAGNHVWDAMIKLDDTVANNYGFNTTNIVKGNSKVNQAELTIDLNSHNIIYGTPEAWVQNRYGINGTPVVVPQDSIVINPNGVTISSSTGHVDNLTFDYNNTGYSNGQTVGVGPGYYLQAANVKVNDGTPVAGGTNQVIASTQNYKVTIKAGDVVINKRPVVIDKPSDPTDNPKYPGTGNPFDPNNIVDPTTDPTYNPNNPDDPRNQLILTGNTVERYEGVTKIIHSMNPDGTPDGKHNYGLVPVYGLPSGINVNTLGVNVADPIAQDGGVTGPDSTAPVGNYFWTGTVTGLDTNIFDLTLMPDIEGVSIVSPLPERPPVVEDLYPWLHNTNDDHGWGHQEHWRERKAEVKFTIGGADFFNDLAKAEAEDDAEVKES